MRVLLDTNVILDVILARVPHAVASKSVVDAVESGVITGLLSATTITTIHYFASKALGSRKAAHHLRTLLTLFEIASVNLAVLNGALQLGFPDYEDAVLHEAARHAKATAIVTRDGSGFKRAELTVYSPGELLSILKLN